MNNQEKGFTTVEMMVVLAVSTLIFFGIVGVSVTGTNQSYAMDTKMTLQDSVRQGLVRMLEEIRESAPSRIQCNDSYLDFQIPSGVDADGDVIWSDTIRYALGGLANQQLLRTQSGMAIALIANDVENIRFISNSGTYPTMITVVLDVKRKGVDGHDYSETITGEAKIRNE